MLSRWETGKDIPTNSDIAKIEQKLQPSFLRRVHCYKFARNALHLSFDGTIFFISLRFCKSSLLKLSVSKS